MKMAPFFLSALILVGGCIPTPTSTKISPVVVTRGSKTTARPVETPAPADVFTCRSRDGRLEATGTLLREPNYHGRVTVRDLKSGRLLATWPQKGGVTGLSFSPDARLLAANSPGGLTVWEWKSKRRVYAHSFDTGGGQYRIQSAFSPDGKQLAVTFGNLAVFDVASWKAQRFPQLQEPAFVDDVRWSPNGRLLALSHHDISAFSLVDVKHGRVGFLKGIDAMSEPVFSADSRYLAGATANSGTFIWKTKDGVSVSVGGDYGHPLIPIAFAKDARFLACRDEKERVGVWRTRDGKQVVAPQNKSASVETLFERARKLK
jgi:WD40 repeat protein